MRILSYKLVILSLSFLTTSCFSRLPTHFRCFNAADLYQSLHTKEHAAMVQLNAILDKPLCKQHLDEALEIIVKEKKGPARDNPLYIDLLISATFGRYLDADCNTRSYALQCLQYFKPSELGTVIRMMFDYEHIPLAKKIRRWQSILEEGEYQKYQSTSTQGPRDIFENQHISPWRKKREIITRLTNVCAEICTLTAEEKNNIKARVSYDLLQDIRNKVESLLKDLYYNPEIAWRKILAPEINLLLNGARNISGVQDEAALWEERVAGVPERQVPAIVHSSFSTVDEARSQSRKVLEWWHTRVNETSSEIAQQELETAQNIHQHRQDVITYLAIELSAKATASAIGEINEQLAKNARKRDHAKLEALAGHLARFPELTKPLSMVTAISYNEHRTALPQLSAVSTILQTLHGIVLRLKQTTLQQQMQPRITMTPSLQIPVQRPPLPERNQATASAAAAAVCACAPSYSSSNQPNLEQLVWTQQQQIIQLLEQQRKQQEQLQLLFARVFEQQSH